jgi:nicotinate-nucleotide adenylyltransferase
LSAKSKRREHLSVPMAAPRMRIGLLGGSFNPAHAAHRHISLTALKRLGLDQVWWLVSPGNPLKDSSKLPGLGERVEAAKEIAQHPRIVVTGFEKALRSVHTIDTIRFLKKRYPQVNFVWLMGADNLADFHHWRDWEQLFRVVPIAAFDRPGFALKALAGKAARRFASARIDESDLGGLPLIEPPVWTFVTLPLSRLSSTALRGRCHIRSD